MTFPHPLVMIPLRHCGGYEFLSFKNEMPVLKVIFCDANRKAPFALGQMVTDDSGDVIQWCQCTLQICLFIFKT